MRLRAPIIIVCSAALVACGSSRGLPTGRLSVDDGPDGVSIRVEIAETSAARASGLMHRTSLGADAGMAFLFDEPTEGGFWMKDTLIPLSIAFWDEHGRIVAMLDMEPCPADPCPIYDPGTAYVGAVEVNRGYLEEAGVPVGATVRLQRDGA